MSGGSLAGSRFFPLLLLLTACNDPVEPPRALPLGESVVDVATVMAETCALTGDHRTFCWVSDSFPFHVSAEPRLVNTPEPLVNLEAGSGVFSGQFCGQSASGSVYCWGLLLSIDVSVNLGDGTTPIKIGDGFQLGSLAVAAGHACALGSDSTARCWGSYLSAKRGLAAPFPIVHPIPTIGWADLDANTVEGGERFVALAAGAYHTCGTRVDRTVACWGDSAEVGAPANVWRHDGDTCLYALACSPTPALVGNSSGTFQLASGGQRTCALTAGGTRCWGGAGGAVPEPLELPITPVQLTISDGHACGLSASGVAWCVGGNGDGQLGGGSLSPAVGPVQVRFSGQFVQLSAGTRHTCGIDSRGRLYCWGDASYGSLVPWAGATPVRLRVPD